MNRAEWTEVAKALQRIRLDFESRWPPRGGYISTAPGVHEQRLLRAARLEAIDELARSMCLVLKSRSSRFDPAKFLAIVNGSTTR